MNVDPHLDVVDSAVASLRDTRVPPGPPSAVLEQTLSVLREEGQAPIEKDSRETTRAGRWVGPWRIAAGVMVVLGMSLAVYWGMGSSKIAFADVLANVRQVQSVRFTQRWTDASGNAAAGEILLADPARMRVEQTSGPGAGSVTIMVLAERKGIALLPGKYAMALSMTDDARSTKRLRDFASRNLIEHFRLWQESDAKRVGETTLAGREVTEFRIARPGQDTTLWVDPRTRLPVRIVMRQPAGDGKQSELVFENFRWDEPYEASELSLSPPKGYSIDRFPLDLAEPSEADLIEALRTFAELRGGVFPDDLSLMGLLMSANRMAATRPAESRPAQSQHVSRAMAIGRGLLFAGESDYGSDWQYAGKDVRLGDADRAILWYRPVKGQGYRVIYADLSARDAEAAPAVESIPITRSADPRGRIRLP